MTTLITISWLIRIGFFLLQSWLCVGLSYMFLYNPTMLYELLRMLNASFGLKFSHGNGPDQAFTTTKT